VDLNAPENDHAHTRLIDVAALQGLPEVVRLLLQHGARVRPKPGQNDAVEIHPIGEAMLGLTAASQPPARYEATIRLLLEAGADPDDMAIPALHMSALGTLAVAAKSAEAVSIARLLVEHGATLDRTASFTSPLLLATKHDRDDLLGPLLTASRARCEPLTEALRLSESKHYYRISDQLVASGADPNIKGESHTPLLCEALQTVERPTSFALTLLVHHANPNVTCDEGPPLFLAIKDPNLVSALLEHGADPNRARADGATPLTVMVKADHQTTDLLLAHGARLGFVTKEADAYRKHGVTLDPVVWAILHHQDYLATRLIQRDGMDSIDSKAAVVYAASEGSILALTELLQHGADPNSSSVSGISALMAAAYHGQTATLEELLAQSGLQVNGTTPPHFTPAGILKFYSENRKPLLSGQRTALMYAAAGSNVEALKILIAHGARTNLQDAEGLRAVDYARIAAMRTALTELSTAH
jgi:ankyrin repeat protein